MNTILNILLCFSISIVNSHTIPKKIHSTSFNHSSKKSITVNSFYENYLFLNDSTRFSKVQSLHLEQNGNYIRIGNIYKQISQSRGFNENFIRYNDSSNYLYYLKSKDTLSALITKYNKGIKLRRNRVFSRALESLFISLKLSQQINNDTLTVKILNDISIIYMIAKDFDQAKTLSLQAIKIAKDIDNEKLTCKSYINYGNLLLRQKKIDSAISCFQTSLRISKHCDLKKSYKKTLSNLAEGYISKKEYHLGLKYAKMCELAPNESGKPPIHTSMLVSDAYFGLGDTSKGFYYLIKGYDEAYNKTGLHNQLKAEQRISTYYESIGNYKLALSHKNKYQLLLEKFQNDEMILEIQKMKVGKLFSKKNKTIDNLVQDSIKIRLTLCVTRNDLFLLAS